MAANLNFVTCPKQDKRVEDELTGVKLPFSFKAFGVTSLAMYGVVDGILRGISYEEQSRVAQGMATLSDGLFTYPSDCIWPQVVLAGVSLLAGYGMSIAIGYEAYIKSIASDTRVTRPDREKVSTIESSPVSTGPN